MEIPGWGVVMSRCKLTLLSVGLCLLIFIQAFPQDIGTNLATETDRHHKKPRRQDDLKAVGHRSIGGRGFLNWYSIEQETDLGRDYSRAVEQDAKLLTDPVVAKYINRIGQNLVLRSDAKATFTIKVIESDEINAYALPGGFLYINSALIMAAQDEAELAAVMAHEIAHVAAHHAARQITRAHMFSLASLPIIFVGGPVGIAIEEATKLVTPFASTKFSRHLEREADYLKVEYMYLAGYDPQAFISFFERLQGLELEKPHTLSKIFAMHPQTADRIRKTQAEITRILPARDLYVTNTSEFDDVKLRLAALSTRDCREQQFPNPPTLRRRPDVKHDAWGSIDEGHTEHAN